MISRLLALGAAAVFTCMTAASAFTPEHRTAAPLRSGSAPLHVFGGRTPAQAASLGGSKLDSALGAVVRRLPTVRAEHAVEDLRGLNPAMRFRQPAGAEPLVLIDAVTRGDPNQLKATLVALGLQHPAQYLNDVGGWLPISQLQTASLQSEVHSMRAAMPRTRSGAATTQGDFVMHADEVRSENALDGSGVTVGVISDSYNCYAHYAAEGLQASGDDGYASNGFTATATNDISTGDLPASAGIKILEDASCDAYSQTLQLPFGDEGRAMMQIVHDVAPGAGVAFYTAENSEADFASGIAKLAASTASGGAGAKVIVDDVGYFNEAFFQDGLVAQAISSVVAAGTVYFSAAGNNGETAYDSTSPGFTVVGSGSNAGETLLTFDSTHGTNLPLTIPALFPGEFIAVVVEWDQPYVTGAPNSGGATSQIDLCLKASGSASDLIINDNGQTLSSSCTGVNSLHQDPVQLVLIGNPANATGNTAAENVNIVVGLKTGGTVPGRIKIAVEANGANVTLPSTGATVQGHPNAAAAIAVGAARYYHTPACGASVVTMESYSSRGGDPQLFDTSGTRLTAAVARSKPDLVGPDGGNDTFLGEQDTNAPTAAGSCKNNTSFPNFLGTSAAAPHVAAVAALLLQADPSLSPSDIKTALTAGAIATDKAANFQGAGFVQASDAATRIPAIVPAAPVLGLSSATITLGASSTLTWTSANNQGCTASGSWTGSQAANGSLVLTPTVTGTTTYSLVCANFAGSSPASSAILTVNAATAAPSGSSGGGGGASDVGSLLALALLTGAARRLRGLRR